MRLEFVCLCSSSFLTSFVSLLLAQWHMFILPYSFSFQTLPRKNYNLGMFPPSKVIILSCSVIVCTIKKHNMVYINTFLQINAISFHTEVKHHSKNTSFVCQYLLKLRKKQHTKLYLDDCLTKSLEIADFVHSQLL